MVGRLTQPLGNDFNLDNDAVGGIVKIRIQFHFFFLAAINSVILTPKNMIT